MRTISLLALVFLIFGFSRSNLKSPESLKGNWHQHIDDAYIASKKSNKPIFALFTGSDWCKPCQALESNYLSSDEFEVWAEENVVLLYVDSPMKKTVSNEHWQHVRSLRSQLSQSGFPTIIVFDAEKATDTSYVFSEWGRISGYDNDSTFKAELINLMN